MERVTLTAAIVTLVLVLGGCTAGILYTHTQMPLTHDFHATPAGGSGAMSDIKHVQLPFYALGVAWGDVSLGDLAKEQGLNELYFADLEYLSVLTIWRQYTVHLYGR